MPGTPGQSRLWTRRGLPAPGGTLSALDCVAVRRLPADHQRGWVRPGRCHGAERQGVLLHQQPAHRDPQPLPLLACPGALDLLPRRARASSPSHACRPVRGADGGRAHEKLQPCLPRRAAWIPAPAPSAGQTSVQPAPGACRGPGAARHGLLQPRAPGQGEQHWNEPPPVHLPGVRAFAVLPGGL